MHALLRGHLSLDERLSTHALLRGPLSRGWLPREGVMLTQWGRDKHQGHIVRRATNLHPT